MNFERQSLEKEYKVENKKLVLASYLNSAS